MSWLNRRKYIKRDMVTKKRRVIPLMFRNLAFFCGLAAFLVRLQTVGLLSNLCTSNSWAWKLWEKGVRGPGFGTPGGKRRRLAAAAPNI